VIEFVLLFALGFLAAALVALIVAPIIQRRVVSLTERRIRSSVPLSVAEIRAEKDMARAAFAAENARLSVDLKHNRDQLTESVAHGTRLSKELVSLRAEKLAAEALVEEHDNSIRDLHGEIHDRDAKITTLAGQYSDAARLAEARKHEIAVRDDKINRIGAEIEELRIDVVTLDTEVENFKSQIRELRNERNGLRDALKDTEAVNRDLENRLKSNDERLSQSEEKLAKTITALTDRENALDRRIAEVERFKKKNRELSDELRAVRNAAREAGISVKAVSVTASAAEQPEEPATPEELLTETGGDDLAAVDVPVKAVVSAPPPIDKPVDRPVSKTAEPRQPAQQDPEPRPAIKAAVHPLPMPEVVPEKLQVTEHLSEEEKIDRLRARQAALIERLLKADKSTNDAALRREIATVAAMMVELTASRDGSSSPIFKILKGNEDTDQADDSEPSLAARARELLASHH